MTDPKTLGLLCCVYSVGSEWRSASLEYRVVTMEHGIVPEHAGWHRRSPADLNGPGTRSSGELADGSPILHQLLQQGPNTDRLERPSVAAAEPASRRATASKSATSKSAPLNSGVAEASPPRNGTASDTDLAAAARPKGTRSGVARTRPKAHSNAAQDV